MGHGGGQGGEHGMPDRGPGGPAGDPGEHDDELIRHQDGGHGKSASSPGHLKKAAGAQSARDYAPGRQDSSAPGQDPTTGHPTGPGDPHLERDLAELRRG
jgi:hypothetical protein